MPIFNSEKYTINVDQNTLSTFLSAPANLKEILPQDRIEDWKSEGDSCSFKIKGLAGIALKLENHDDKSVIYASASEKPFPFKLSVRIADASGKSEIDASFDADVNTFMAMMLKTPLTNFLNSLGEAIRNKYS